MNIRNMADDFERLQGVAMKITQALEDHTNCPSDAVMVLGMIAAYFMNMHRQDGVTLNDAQKSYFGLVSDLASLGEEVGKKTLQ